MKQRILAFFRARRPRGDGGYSTETIVVVGLLIAMAVTAVGFISVEVERAADAIAIQAP